MPSVLQPIQTSDLQVDASRKGQGTALLQKNSGGQDKTSVYGSNSY